VTVRREPKPAPLLVAASLAALEGLLLLGYAVAEVASLDRDRVAVALTTAVFFTAYGVLLVACAWALSRGRSWARSPVVLAQLIQLGLAWSFRGGDTTAAAVAIAVVAVVVLVGLFVPSSIDALADRPEER
jgi:threonine/homoserine efflux transporter RhtA